MKTGTVRCLSVLVLIAVVLLPIACIGGASSTPARTAEPSPTAKSAGSLPGKPVFQVDPPIVLGPSFKAAGYDLPLVTIWDNGRVVFRYSKLGGGPTLHETTLERAEVQQILEKARFLYDLGDTHTMGQAGSSIRFSVETELGRKVVWVRSFDGFEERPVPVDESEDSRRIRDLWATVEGVLPSQAPLMQPDEAVVRVEADYLAESRESYPSEVTRAAKTWPKELVGHLKGEQARNAASLLDPGALDVFLIDGKLREVTVQPVLPLLYEPTPNWPRAGMPRHPAITAYNAPGMPFRFAGVTQHEAVAWYLEEMPTRGWRLGGHVEDRRQVWAWEQYDPSPLLVDLQFQPTEMIIRRIELVDGIPLKGRYDICGDVRCQIINGATKAEVETWFAEFMPYAGWQRGPDGDHRKGNWQVRLEMREADLNGTGAVQVLLHRAWAAAQAGEPSTTPIPPFGPGPAPSLASCFEIYGPDTLKNRDFAFDGTIKSIERRIDPKVPPPDQELYWVTFDVNHWYKGGKVDEVAVWIESLWLSRSTVQIGTRLLVSGEPRWGGEPLDDALAWMGCGFTRLYTPEEAEEWADFISP